jgi:hypothetical protein
MNIKQNINKQFSFKLCINTLSICVLSLMILPTHAEEKAPTADVKEAATDIKTVAAAIAAFGLPDNLIEKSKTVVIEIPADVKAAVEKKLLSKIEIKKVEIDPAASEVFRAPIYKVRPELGYIAVVDGEVLNLNKPSSNFRLPGYLKLIREDFMLDSEEKANTLASALQLTFPYKLKKIVKPVKVKHGWIIFRGKFFKNYSGLVFTTNEQGKITLVEYVLKINPKDYSYEPPTDITL